MSSNAPWQNALSNGSDCGERGGERPSQSPRFMPRASRTPGAMSTYRPTRRLKAVVCTGSRGSGALITFRLILGVGIEMNAAVAVNC
jgi:hypothetical protein